VKGKTVNSENKRLEYISQRSPNSRMELTYITRIAAVTAATLVTKLVTAVIGFEDNILKSVDF
jgi:hypothetical protein